MAKEKKAPEEVVGEETKVEQVAPNAETVEAPASETKTEEEKPVVDAPEQVAAPEEKTEVVANSTEETKAEAEAPKEDVEIAEEKTETATAELNAEIAATEESVQPNVEQPADPTENLEFEEYWDIMSHSPKKRLVVKK